MQAKHISEENVQNYLLVENMQKYKINYLQKMSKKHAQTQYEKYIQNYVPMLFFLSSLLLLVKIPLK